MKNQKLINKILGYKFKQDRMEKKLSLRKVNAKVGISQQMLFKIENGKTEIYNSYLYILSSFYGKPIDDYFTYLIQELKKYENKD
jgi:transcriptional regulator with XRE-family HTH domain